jgi:serine/threonine-protein kinase
MTIEKFGRYEVISEIGRGGMATVYEANDPLFNRRVAVKMLPAELLHDPAFRTRFEREAKTVAGLDHPAIVPVYDYGEAEGRPFYIMRLMTGGSLADRIKKGPLPLPEVVRIFVRIAPGLDEAHCHGVIHRDIKPANILFDQRNDPFLSDFGIAKLSESGGLTLTGGGIIGTPAYMSPEQGRGDSDIDGRSDIYSLGVILFEMLSGRVPYESDTPMGLVVMHITAPIPNLLEVKPELPPACQEVITRAMAKRKFLRYNTASEMARDLAAIVERKAPQLAGLPETKVSAGKPAPVPGSTAVHEKPRGATTPRDGVTPRDRLTPRDGLPHQTPPPGAPRATPQGAAAAPPQKRTSWLLWIFLLAFGLVLLFGIGTALILPALIPQQTETPVAMLENTVTPTSQPAPSDTPDLIPPTETVSPPDDTPTSGVVEPPAPSVTPTLTPAPIGPAQGGADLVAFIKDNDVWMANLDGSLVERLTNTGGSKSSLQWMPDGTAVKYIQGKCLQTVDIEKPHTVHVVTCINAAEYLAAAEISPNGKLIALSLNVGLYILPYDLAVLQQIDRLEELKAAQGCATYTESSTRGVRWSENSQSLAVVVVATRLGRKEDEIRVLDVSRCGSAPVVKDRFPADRFTIHGFAEKPLIQSFGWDGNEVFALNAEVRTEYGDFYLYYMDSHKVEEIMPIGKQCCYRDFHWSPDGQWVVFSFRDSRYDKEVKLYYLRFGEINAGQEFTPFPLPPNFFGPQEKPQPVLRPVR